MADPRTLYGECLTTVFILIIVSCLQYGHYVFTLSGRTSLQSLDASHRPPYGHRPAYSMRARLFLCHYGLASWQASSFPCSLQVDKSIIQIVLQGHQMSMGGLQLFSASAFCGLQFLVCLKQNIHYVVFR